MDFKLLFSGGKDIPADVRMIYGGLIKRHQKLKNGWSAVLLRNNMAYLYKNNAQPILVGGIKRIFEAADGKFMLVKENGEKAVLRRTAFRRRLFPQVPNCIGMDGIRLTTVKAFPFLRQTASASAAGLRQPAFLPTAVTLCPCGMRKTAPRPEYMAQTARDSCLPTIRRSKC